ncbi:MAG: DUF1573 domain-containing protein, partial [Phycisphaerales bacterium]|nr:DUF1573 domain-containing protein [Phycisphaerales bacterium]
MRMFRTTRSRPLARRPLAHAVSGCAAALALTFILPLALGGCDEAGTSGNDRSGTAAAVTPASRSATVAAPYDRSPVDNEAEKALHRIVMPASPEFVQPMDQPGAPPLRFEPPTLHYGVLAPGETATGAVKIWNVGTQPVTLGNFRVSCHCTSVDLTNGVIAPGGYKEFHIFT